MCQLIQLKELNLHRNQFRDSLPDVVCQLTALNKLSLRECGLKDLPLRYSIYTSGIRSSHILD